MIIPHIRRVLASAGVLAFAVIVTMVLAVGDDAPSIAAVESVVASAPSGAARRPLAALAAFAAIAERPLFLPSRRPEAQPKPEVPVASAPVEPVAVAPLSATLVGTLQSSDGGSAILRFPDGKSVVVAEGGEVQGWKLIEVSADRAVFSLGTAQSELAFAVHKPSPGEASSSPLVPVRRRR